MVVSCCADGVPSKLSGTNNMFIVGIQSGKDELKSGQPFTGSNGKLLSACLASVDLDINDFYLCNILCGPSCTLEKGLEYFWNQVRQYKPQLIITLGAPACEAVLKVKLGTVRGQMCQFDYGYILPTVMPIAALQGGGAAVGSDLVRDFKKIPYILDFKPKPFTYDVVTSTEQAQYVLNMGYESIDIETMEVPDADAVDQEDAWDWQLECLAIGDTEHAYVFPADVFKDVNLIAAKPYLGHNAWSFDRAGINRYLGVTIDIQEDTLLAAYALDERRISSIHTPLLKLKPLCREYIGADFWESGKATDVYKYNAQDAINTARLHERLTVLMKQDNVYDMYKNLLIPAAKVLSDAQIYGVKIDVDELLRLLLAWIPRLSAMEQHLQSEAHEFGWPTTNINCNSPQQLSKFLFEVLGLPVGHYTKAGKPSTDKEVLNELDHPFVTTLLEHRALDKVISGYLLSAKKHLKYDGRIHPKPLLHGTVTGRPSYTDPPVQTIPQEHTVGSLAELRRMFVPSSDAYDILEADYAQLDIWMGACLSQDQQMLADLQDAYWPDGTADYHSRVTENVLKGDPLHAKYAYGTTERKIWEHLRFMAKKVTFGIMFMEGPNGLANKHTGIGCSVYEAQRYIAAWYKRYPVFKEWQRAIVKQAHDEGELVSVFGRKRRFPLIVDHRSDRQAGNFPIQSAESDCTLTSAIELHPQLLSLDSHILFLVHDSIVIERCLAHKDEVALLVKIVMEKPRAQQLVSVPVEIKAGPNWYDTTKVAA